MSAFRIAMILTYAVFSLAPHRASAAAEKAESVQASLAKLGQGIDDASLLTDAGSTIQWRDLVGQPRALFFGFTNCPSVCPVAVWELDTAMAEIGPSAADLKIIFVTLDPARDTPAALKKYFSGFKGRVIPLSGQEPEIQRVAKSFEVTSEKVDSGNGNYTLDHTGAVYLLDKQGGVVDTLAFGTPRDVTLARLKKLLAASK